jgi:hypothetical protein
LGLQAHFFKINVKVLGIPSPKGDIDGSQVGHVFYVDKDIDRIVACVKRHCCCSDFLRLRREELLRRDYSRLIDRYRIFNKWKLSGYSN